MAIRHVVTRGYNTGSFPDSPTVQWLPTRGYGAYGEPIDLICITDSYVQPTAGGSRTQPTAGGSRTQPTSGGSRTQPTAGGSRTQPGIGGSPQQC